MQMIDVLKRLAELDAQNPNIVSEVSKELAAKAYNKMAVGDDPWKNRTGLAGDQSDRMKARMDKRWGKDEVDATVQKSREQGVDEELKGDIHPDAEKILKHIKPEHHKTYTPYLKKGVYKGDYRDRADVLSAAEKAGHAKESVAEALAECGMMGSMSQPHTPASINMTADSGMELTGMLKDIMSLAGLKQVGPDDLGHDHEPSVMTGEPGVSVAKPDAEPMDMKSMIAKMDTLNVPDDNDSGSDMDSDEDDKETDEGLIGGILGGAAGAAMGGLPGAAVGYAAGSKASDDLSGEEKTEETISSLSAPKSVPVPPGTQDAAGHPGVGDRMDGDRPKAFPKETTYESLMSDYRKFVAESDQTIEEGSGPKEKAHSKYVDRNSPDSKAKVQAAKDKMASDEKAKPGKELADKIAKKSVAEESQDIIRLAGIR